MAPSSDKSPSYKGRRPASEQASEAARGASKKHGTRCERVLARALWGAGCRYSTDVAELPGRPDLVFSKVRLAIFCDGDFWHGRDWTNRRAKLAKGSNSGYWIAKIQSNIDRDRRRTEELIEQGWTVLRFWESDIHDSLPDIVAEVLEILDAREHRKNPD